MRAHRQSIATRIIIALVMRGNRVNDAYSLLRAHGMRVTAARKAVIDELSNMRHSDAEELVKRLAAKGISRAAVYRALSLLERVGIVSRALYGERHSHFELACLRQPHDHLICIRCGRVIEFECPEVERLQSQVVERHEFEFVNRVFEIRGVCPKCRKKESYGELMGGKQLSICGAHRRKRN